MPENTDPIPVAVVTDGVAGTTSAPAAVATNEAAGPPSVKAVQGGGPKPVSEPVSADELRASPAVSTTSASAPPPYLEATQYSQNGSFNGSFFEKAGTANRLQDVLNTSVAFLRQHDEVPVAETPIGRFNINVGILDDELSSLESAIGHFKSKNELVLTHLSELKSSLHLIGEMKEQVGFFGRSQKVSNSDKYTQILRTIEEAVTSATANKDTRAGQEEINTLVKFRKSVSKFIAENAALVEEILPKITAYDHSPGTISVKREGGKNTLIFTQTGRVPREITQADFPRFVDAVSRLSSSSGLRLVEEYKPSTDAKPKLGGTK